VQAFGTASEYQLSRKLYFNTLYGFGNIAAEGAAGTSGDPNAADEIVLAQFESVAANIDPILTQYHEFPIGPSPNGAPGTPFCEDFNEQKICGAAANVNGCNNNTTVSGIPADPSAVPTVATTSTVCGNGIVEDYEECDFNDTTPAPNKSGSGCSSTCRCRLDYNPNKVNTAPESVGGCN
jgi:hypothetical protein